MNYDEEFLGVMNPLHPANQQETEEFNSEDLTECLHHYLDTGDRDYLEMAISENAKKLENIKETVIQLRQYARATDNTYLVNILTRLFNTL